ncbi:MAG: SagB/ThcOx family dehydrogenase, partial [Candidatus Lindowbacteria bacterium]|nr:SagB/ThcOx family dehydrogenase [Candidatus Lindowbacteria bacterium]
MQYENIGDSYHHLTKYVRGAMPRGDADWSPRPSLKKTFGKQSKLFLLPAPVTSGGPALWDTIHARRSLRSYRRTPLSLKEVSQLLWATQGTTQHVGDYKLRSAPSAGALYPIETYLVVNRVTGLEPGVYHYDALEGVLQLLKEGESGSKAAAAALDQFMAEDAAVVLIWTAVVGRGKWKYQERAYRYIYMDAGHVA